MQPAAFLDDADILLPTDLVRDLQVNPHLSAAEAVSRVQLQWGLASKLLTYWVGRPLGDYRKAADGRWPIEVMRRLPNRKDT